MPRTTATRGRRATDRKLAEIRPIDRFAVPPRGWIKALREALAMSQADLAKRLDITQASVASMERSEANGKIQIDTLHRVADALDCDLVYVLVPRRSLEATLHDAALQKVSPHRHAVAQTMSLEDQDSTPDAELIEREVERLIESGRVWR